MKPRMKYFWPNFLLTSTEKNWIETFRMSRGTFFYICLKLQNKLAPRQNYLIPREPISTEEQVAICIYYLASTAEYRVVGDVFGVHKSTVWKCVHNVVDAILNILMPEWIKMPDEKECKTISDELENISHIPQIIGIVDGSHIPILPPQDGHADYINRKGWASIVLQAVVDNHLM